MLNLGGNSKPSYMSVLVLVLRAAVPPGGRAVRGAGARGMRQLVAIYS
jgi:hypothetical protein